MSQPGRRSAAARKRRLNATAILAALLPLLTIGALFLAQAHAPSDRGRPPEPTTLTSASVICPSSAGGSVFVGTGEESVRGDVASTSAGEEREVPVRSGEVSEVEGVTEPVVVTGTGELAPGLLAARFGARRLAALDCPDPRPEAWFTGVGAGARHNSVLELVNPDAGPAVADVTVHAPRGVIDVPELRGVTVSGRDRVRLDLGVVVPRRTELALHVVVSRGRLAPTVLDEIPSLGAEPATLEWLPGQHEPTTRAVLIGLAPGVGTGELAVTNPGADEARVGVKVVTADAVFSPEGLDEIVVPPGRVRTVSLTDTVRPAIRDGAIGIEVTSSVPVTASMRSVVGGDLSFPAPVARSAGPTSLLVPPGEASVVLADSEAVGVAVVDSWTAAGRQLETQRLELTPGTGGTVDLPENAALVRVTPQRTAVRAALLVGGQGATVVPFRELVVEKLIPDVRPGLS